MDARNFPKGVNYLKMPYCHLDYGQMYYDDFGSGTPILMIHPPAMGRKVFYYQEPLQEKFRLILPDLSGHGDSKAEKVIFSTIDYVKEIHALLDHLGLEKAILCGYSTGGNYVQEFALRYPERTISVILCGGFPEIESHILKYEHIVGMYMVKHYPHLLAKGISTAHTADKKVRDLIYEHMLKANQDTWFYCYHDSLKYSCLDRLHKFQIPLYLFYGSRDFTNKHIRYYQKRVSMLKTIVIKNVAHQIITKKAQKFNQQITQMFV